MGKIVHPDTPEFALQRAIEGAGAKRVAEAISKGKLRAEGQRGCSVEMVYKMADPDQPHRISVADALAVDAFCFAKEGMAPFAELFSRQRDDAAVKLLDIKHELVECTAQLGVVSSALLQAVGSTSEHGAQLSRREIQSIMVSMELLKKELADVERAVIAASIVTTRDAEKKMGKRPEKSGTCNGVVEGQAA